MNDINLRAVSDVDAQFLTFIMNSEAETYQPCWRFTIEGYAAILVNCFSGGIYEM